jgi:DNA-binding GntR family transcriptional regulator
MDRSAAEKSGKPVVDYVIDAIREGIKEGRYSPGQRLIELDLTRQLGVSRGPFREALRRLVGDGLIVNEPHRGAYVRTFSRKDVEDLYRVREVIEGLAARLAAEAVKAGDKARDLGRVWKDMEKQRANYSHAAYMRLNEQFHDQIVRLSGNGQLERLVEQMRMPIFRLRADRLLSSGHFDSLDQHEQIYHAIMSGDGARADREMRRHISYSAKLVLGLPDLFFA